MNQTAMQQYQNVGVNSGVTDADPHQLIAMLLCGATDRIAAARGALLRGDVGRQGELISAAIAIVDSLRASLDHDRGGDIADNLRALYDYMERRLVEANLAADASLLEEVSGLLAELKAGWEAIPTAARRAG